MFAPREIRTSLSWSHPDGTKIYTISARSGSVDRAPFMERMAKIKAARTMEWSKTPHFAIFHEGASLLYLILAWWGNENELFSSVSVLTEQGWIEDAARYSFCLYDLEIFWSERNAYIQTIDCAFPDIDAYRQTREIAWLE